MLQPSLPSIESRRSWHVAFAAVAILACSFGSPWIMAVGLKVIAAEMGGARSYPALAVSLACVESMAAHAPVPVMGALPA